MLITTSVEGDSINPIRMTGPHVKKHHKIWFKRYYSCDWTVKQTQTCKYYITLLQHVSSLLSLFEPRSGSDLRVHKHTASPHPVITYSASKELFHRRFTLSSERDVCPAARLWCLTKGGTTRRRQTEHETQTEMLNAAKAASGFYLNAIIVCPLRGVRLNKMLMQCLGISDCGERQRHAPRSLTPGGFGGVNSARCVVTVSILDSVSVVRRSLCPRFRICVLVSSGWRAAAAFWVNRSPGLEYTCYSLNTIQLYLAGSTWG